jgi:hypothetical protein
MRNEMFAVLCLITGSMPSLAEGPEKPNDKVILTVNATVHATASRQRHEGSMDMVMNDELTCQLIETVEYKILGKVGKGRMWLEDVSDKNHMTASGKGYDVIRSEDVGENKAEWTYSIRPTTTGGHAGISEIDSGPPYKVRIGINDFFENAYGTRSGTDKYVAGWEPGAPSPTYKTEPIDKQHVGYATTANNWVFVSPEEAQLDTKRDMTALAIKLQGTYIPRKDGGFSTSGNATHSYTKTDETGTTYDASVNISWSIQCGAAPDEDEVFVEPDAAYDTWLPKGNLENAEKGGNTLGVRVSVHKQGDPGKPGKAKIVFKLADISMEKGVCMNWPRKTAKSDYGLKFIQDKNENLDVVGPDEAKTKNYVENAQATISAFDFGAWGTLQITAQDEQGRDLKVHVRGREVSEMRVPLDENHNHIADAWEIENVGDLRGQDNDDQETQPKGKSDCPGDGLSLYEEYRGFRVQGDHIRADPKKKDLFLCDNTTGKVAAAGMDLFESATKLKVWRMTYEEMGSDRLINRNGAGGTAHVVDQHGILIEDGPNGIDPRQVPTSEKAPFGPPVLTLFVQLPPGRSYASGDGQADVAHELCHAVGLCHHGDENYYAAEWYWELDSEGAWQLYEQGITTKEVQAARDKNTTKWVPTGNRKPIQALYEPTGQPYRKGDPPPPGSATVGVERWRLQIAGEQSPFSGDQECLMRYADKQAFIAKRDPDHIRYLPDKSQWKMRNRLCTDSKGTGVNEKGHSPQPRYGDAVVGNCRSQLVINDKCANH